MTPGFFCPTFQNNKVVRCSLLSERLSDEKNDREAEKLLGETVQKNAVSENSHNTDGDEYSSPNFVERIFRHSFTSNKIKTLGIRPKRTGG